MDGKIFERINRHKMLVAVFLCILVFVSMGASFAQRVEAFAFAVPAVALVIGGILLACGVSWTALTGNQQRQIADDIMYRLPKPTQDRINALSQGGFVGLTVANIILSYQEFKSVLDAWKDATTTTEGVSRNIFQLSQVPNVGGIANPHYLGTSVNYACGIYQGDEYYFKNSNPLMANGQILQYTVPSTYKVTIDNIANAPGNVIESSLIFLGTVSSNGHQIYLKPTFTRASSIPIEGKFSLVYGDGTRISGSDVSLFSGLDSLMSISFYADKVNIREMKFLIAGATQSTSNGNWGFIRLGATSDLGPYEVNSQYWNFNFRLEQFTLADIWGCEGEIPYDTVKNAEGEAVRTPEGVLEGIRTANPGIENGGEIAIGIPIETGTDGVVSIPKVTTPEDILTIPGEGTVDPPVDVPEEGTISGILSNIWNFLKGLVQAIIDGFKSLAIALFVPPDDFFDTKLPLFVDDVYEKFPIVEQFADMLNMVSDMLAGIVEKPHFGFTLWGATVEFVNFDLFDPYLKYFKTIVLIFAYYFFIRRYIRKVAGLIGSYMD